MIDKSELFAKRIATNISRYTPAERKVILARYGAGSALIQSEIKQIILKERKWLST